MKLKAKSVSSILGCLLVGLLNQNCGEQSSLSSDSLAANHSPSMLDVDLPESQANVGDRIFVSSVFADIFLPHGNELTVDEAQQKAGEESYYLVDYISSEYSESEDGPIFDVINDFILSNIAEFHGPCSVVENDTACNARVANDRIAAASQQTIAPAAVTRAGYRISTCNILVSNDRAIENLVYNLSGARKTVMDESHIMAVYNAFYPEQSIDPDAYESLKDVYVTALNDSNLNRWRTVVIPICHSSGWQIQ